MVGEIGLRCRQASIPEGDQAVTVDGGSARAAMSVNEGYVCGPARKIPARQAHSTHGSALQAQGARAVARNRGVARERTKLSAEQRHAPSGAAKYMRLATSGSVKVRQELTG